MHDLLAALAIVPLETDGVIDWVNQKNTEALTAIRAVSITVAVIFLIVVAVKSRMAMAAVVVAGVAAAIFVFIVFNVTSASDRVKTEMTAGPISAVHGSVVHDSARAPAR